MILSTFSTWIFVCVTELHSGPSFLRGRARMDTPQPARWWYGSSTILRQELPRVWLIAWRCVHPLTNYSDAILRFRIPTYEYLSWIYISFDNLLHFRGNGFGNVVYCVYGFQLFNITKVLNSLFHPILQNTFSSALGYIS